MQLTANKNVLFWNIVKGLGALSIVIGHACGNIPYLVRFVYFYHLAIFFFVSGFLYSEEKYGDVPHIYFASRLRSTWFKYIKYMGLYVILHNLFLQEGIIINAKEYAFTDAFINLVNVTVFFGSESMGGALWFVPVLLIACGFFGVVIYAGGRMYQFTGSKIVKMITVIVLTVLLGAAGVYSNRRGMYLLHHMQTSFLVVPIFTTAWLIRYYVKDWMRFVHWVPGIAVCIFLGFGLIDFGWNIELSTNVINGKFSFYVISLLGIYACLAVSKLLTNVPFVNRSLAFLGKYSFDIMAGHFLVLKIIDLIYARMIGESDPQVYGNFPVAFNTDLWLVYIIAAAFFPAMIAFLLEKIKTALSLKVAKNKAKYLNRCC